jgi:hypothetical protein
MANKFFINVASLVTALEMPLLSNLLTGASVQLQPTLDLTDFSSLLTLRDVSKASFSAGRYQGNAGQGVKDILISGARALPSTLKELNIRGGAMEGPFFSSLPSLLEKLELSSNDDKFTGSLPALPSTLTIIEIIGNGNKFEGAGPFAGVATSSLCPIVRVTGSSLRWSGSAFFPTSLHNNLKHYSVANEADSSVVTHTSALPSNLDTATNLITFNGINCKLTGTLPTSIASNVQVFKIGGRASIGTYNNGVTTNQAFPSFSACNSLKTLTISNIKGGPTAPRITSCASTAFTGCLFTSGTKIILSYNAMTSAVVNDILVAIDSANATSTVSGRVIDLRGNAKPTGLTSAATGAGNAAMTSLLAKNWSFLFNTTGQNNNFNWPA